MDTAKDNSFDSDFITSFEPFEVQACLWLVSVSLYMIIAMRITHKTGGRYLKDEQSESSISISAKNEKDSIYKNILRCIGQGVADSLSSFTKGEATS